MLLDEASEVLEMFKHSFPLSMLFFVPLLIIISPASPVSAAHDFAVYRMQQYDLHGSAYGCRNALVNVEARPLDTTSFTRRCLVTKLMEFTTEKYKELITQNAGGVLILLPDNLTSLKPEEKEHVMELEQELLQEESHLPVYFTPETDELLELYHGLKHSINSDQAGSATQALMKSAGANGFQLIVNGPQSKAMPDFQVVNLQGKLSGYGIEEQLPTVAIVAHYDAFGIAPSLSFGSDSNGSGVVALLEMARLFSKLYTSSRTHAKYNMLFLLSGAGKYNYQGTRRWIEDQLDSSENSLLSDVSYVLCVDAIGNGDSLYLHVSKPPKPGSAGHTFYENLVEVASELSPGTTVAQVHKKINLAEDYLSWEHERFSMRRLPAFTLSHLESQRYMARNTILDTRDNVDTKVLTKNVQLITEALARQIFNLNNSGTPQVFVEGLRVESQVVESWMDYLGSTPRSAQLLDKNSAVVNTLEHGLSRYLKDVQRHVFRSDKRDPEFVFYNGATYQMSAYSVKPAVFDLFLALGISSYLAIVFLVAQIMPRHHMFGYEERLSHEGN
ncbi:hypothetical protein LSH36_63g03013 [Paralvinella palmiformis]|uniref:Nicalin n=1 Tax=Paralvinella palmiformis TaxID=53620 RepID=A0AAD9NBR2_9ANNE|nr:hypothetical protein LSH36_63g03013 [Paralvinella palmiformis]